MPKLPPAHLPENTVMREDTPISAEQLAQLACTLYRLLAPEYGLLPTPDWSTLTPDQHACAIAVSRWLLHRVDARIKYVLKGIRASGPLVGKVEDVCEVEGAKP